MGKLFCRACSISNRSINLPYLCSSCSLAKLPLNLSLKDTSTFPLMPLYCCTALGRRLLLVHTTLCEWENIFRVGEECFM
jgi:hypothetical protein